MGNKKQKQSKKKPSLRAENLIPPDPDDSLPLHMGFDLSTQSLSCSIITPSSLVYQKSVRFSDLTDSDRDRDRDIVNLTPVSSSTTVPCLPPGGSIATQDTTLFLRAYDSLLSSVKADSTSWPTSTTLDSLTSFSASGQQHGTVYWSKSASKSTWSSTFSSLSPSNFSTLSSSIWMDSSTTAELDALTSGDFGFTVQEVTGSYPTKRFTGLQVAKVRRVGHCGRRSTSAEAAACASCGSGKSVIEDTAKVELISAFATNLMSDCVILDHPVADYSDGSGMNLLDVNDPKKGYDTRIVKLLDNVSCPSPSSSSSGINYNGNSKSRSIAELMSPPPVISSTLVGSSINDLFASSLGISSPKRRSVIIGTGDNPSTIAGVNLTRVGSDIIISLGTSDTLMGVCRTLPEKYDSKVGHFFVNPCSTDEENLNYFAMICFSNGGRTRERLCNEHCGGSDWKKFDSLLGVSDDPITPTSGVSSLAGNNSKLSINIDVEETVPIIESTGTYKMSLDGTLADEFDDDDKEKWTAEEEIRAAVQGRIMSMRINAFKMGLLDSNSENETEKRRIIVVGGGSNSKGINQIIADVFAGEVLVSKVKSPDEQLSGSDLLVEGNGVNTASLGVACRAMHGHTARERKSGKEKSYSDVCGTLIDSTLECVATCDPSAVLAYDNMVDKFSTFELEIVAQSGQRVLENSKKRKHTVVEIAEMKRSLGALVATVKGGGGGSGSSEKHPEYTLQVKDKRTLVETTVNSRFKAFRELRRVVHRKGLKIEAKFPPTFAKSKLGVSLTEAQLEQRCTELNDWVAELVGKLGEIEDAGVVEAVGELFDLEGMETRARVASTAGKKIEKLVLAKLEEKTEMEKETKKEKEKGNFPTPATKPEGVVLEVTNEGGCCIIF
ncbi:hypothetical protein ScalyP_jg6423 [Parmales sp. scaly parma]|nr:hypothetical protein ScalyP_jg6423 [Parmales sp. scaly parma]